MAELEVLLVPQLVSEWVSEWGFNIVSYFRDKSFHCTDINSQTTKSKRKC